MSAGWAVLLIKDNDKPGFIVHSCSLVTAYDEYLQKGNEGEGGWVTKLSVCVWGFLSIFFFPAGFLPEERPV